jgi:hypothetical protein
MLHLVSRVLDRPEVRDTSSGQLHENLGAARDVAQASNCSSTKGGIAQRGRASPGKTARFQLVFVIREVFVKRTTVGSF